MKFSNGNWLMRENVKSYSPAKVYETSVTGKSATFLVPSTEILHRGYTLGGVVFNIELSSPIENVIKVKMVHFNGKEEVGPFFELKNKDPQVSIENNENALVFQTGDLTATIAKADGWQMSFSNSKGSLTHSGFRNMGYMNVDGEGPYVREQLNIAVDELIYGLGERFTPFVKNGQQVDIWNEDGGTSSEQSYKNIPFYVSSKGYGVFVNHPEKVSFEVGSEKVAKVQFSVPGEALEYYIINGASIKEVLKNYTELTGKPGLPPAWSFGLWLTTSFTTDYDEQTVTSFVDGMLERDIPLHTFHFDCFWMKAYNWCDFTWDNKVFPDPKGMLQRLKAKGLQICVWINPYIAQQSPLFIEGKKGGYLLKNKEGSVWQWDMWQPGMGIVDFTNPEACRWYESKLEALMDMGVDAFKTDFGERIPIDVAYFDGSDPIKMHNYYAYLYNEVVCNVLEKRLGKNNAVLFARSATVGSQKFPVHWGGDCSSVYESMAESLRGGLSLMMSGFGFWSHDIGGFESTSTPDVYKRWAAFGLLSSHSRLHGSSSYRVPWVYDEESVDVVRFFSKLKCTLMPYIYRNAVETSQTGIPLMRSMVIEFPEDRSCHFLDRQYMLGDNLLVAPIFNDAGTVEYYLPKGTWTNFLDNTVVTGGQYVKEHHGYLSLPLMARPNCVIPVGKNERQPAYDYQEDVCYHVFELEDDHEIVTNIYSVENEIVTCMVLLKQKHELTVKIEGVASAFSILFRNVNSAKCEAGEIVQHPLGTLVKVAAGIKTLKIQL